MCQESDAQAASTVVKICRVHSPLIASHAARIGDQPFAARASSFQPDFSRYHAAANGFLSASADKSRCEHALLPPPLMFYGSVGGSQVFYSLLLFQRADNTIKSISLRSAGQEEKKPDAFIIRGIKATSCIGFHVPQFSAGPTQCARRQAVITWPLVQLSREIFQKWSWPAETQKSMGTQR